MDEDEIEETPYFRHFRVHLQEVQDRIHGSSHGALMPSYYPPCGYWTSQEKEQFFHGLSIHSRLRPDLIAADIPTKSVLDICAYLSLLEDVSQKTSREKRRRATIIAAADVSDDWVEYEEQLAERLVQNEIQYVSGAVQTVRKENMQEMVKSLRASEPDKTAFGRARKRVKLELKEEWDAEDCLKVLGPTHLSVIDNIVKKEESEGTPAEGLLRQQDTSNSVIDPTLLAMSHFTTVHGSATGVGVETPLTQPPMANSPVVDQARTQQSPTTSQVATHHTEGLHENSSEVDLSSLSPKARRRHQKRLYMRRKRAEAAGRPFSTTTLRLKPGRRGREGGHVASIPFLVSSPVSPDTLPNILDDAQYTLGQETDNDDEDTNIFGGKQEYEATLEAAANGPPTAAMFQRERDDPDGSQTTLSHKKPKKRGHTLPYKIKTQLLKCGYNAKTLRDMGLDLFHLTRLGKLIDLVTQLYGGVDVETQPDVCSTISIETVKDIRTHIVAFVADLLHRVVVLQEHERLTKGHTKVWRKRTFDVTATNVRRAVRTMNSPLDHHDWLERVAAQADESTKGQSPDQNGNTRTTGGDSSSDEGEVNGDGYDAEQVDEEEEEEDGEDNTSLTAFRAIYQPFLLHEIFTQDSGSLMFMDQCLPRRPCTDELSGTDSDVDEDDLEAELREEEELDQSDLQMSKHVEEDLWEDLYSEDSDACDEYEEGTEDVSANAGI